MNRPQVSLDHLLKRHPATLQSFEKLVANPRSWLANYAFRRHLPTGPAVPSRGVLFADTTRPPTTRISAHVDEYGATVVENSHGVQVGDHNRMRNDFSYTLTGQEISLGRMLRDRPDLARSLAMTARYPGNPAVQRSFTRQISDAYTHGVPSLRILDQDLRGSRLSVDQGVGVQVGFDNARTDKVSVDIRRLVLTGWDSMTKRTAAEIDKRTPERQPPGGPGAGRSPAEPSGPRSAPATRPATPGPSRRTPGPSRPALLRLPGRSTPGPSGGSLRLPGPTPGPSRPEPFEHRPPGPGRGFGRGIGRF